jgi:hypothetical protein
VLEKESEKKSGREFGYCGRDDREELLFKEEEGEIIESE